MSSLHRDDVTELRAALKAAAILKAAVPRADLLERAVEGLTDEQIEAIPRLMEANAYLLGACAEAVEWFEEDTAIDLDELSDDARVVLDTLRTALAKAKAAMS